MTTNNHESAGRNQRYAQHIAQLGAAFGVFVQVKSMAPDGAGAGSALVGIMTPDGPTDVQRVKAIVIAPVIDETTYAVALHELGHCLHPLGMLDAEGSKTWRMTHEPSSLRDIKLQLVSERAAWEWAHHYALEWTDAMAFVERFSIGSYEARARAVGVKP